MREKGNRKLKKDKIRTYFLMEKLEGLRLFGCGLAQVRRNVQSFTYVILKKPNIGRENNNMTEKAGHVLKELVISFVGLIIALIFSALALGIANWGIGVFGITGDVAKGAAIIAVAIVIGPTIAAFATKKYF